MFLLEGIAAEIYDQLLGVEAPRLVERVVEFSHAPREANRPDSSFLGPPRPGPPGPTRPLSAYVGRYSNEDWGTLDIRRDGEVVSARIGDLPLPIVWTAPDRFVAGWDHAGTFDMDDGRVGRVRLGMPLPDTATFVRNRAGR